MDDQRRFITSPPPRRRPGAPILLALCLGLTSLYACSLLVETRDQQCAVDADCTSFPGARCDQARHVCASQSTTSSGTGDSTSASTTSSTGAGTSSSSSSSTGGGGCDAGGCYSCPPTTSDEILNACTDAGCKPFANSTRLQHLTADGGLPPLPSPDGG
jgi:hypothetical protein